MTFVPTIDPKTALQPDYMGTRRVERWTATAAASDSGIGTITPKYLQNIDDYDIDWLGGTAPNSAAVVNGKLLIYLPGTTTPTSFRIKLYSRY